MMGSDTASDPIHFQFLPINSNEWSAYALLDLVDRYEKQVVTVVRFETREASSPHPYYSYAAVFEIEPCRYACVAAQNVATSGYVGGGPMLQYVIEKFLAQKLIAVEPYRERIFSLKPGGEWPPTEQEIRRIVSEGLSAWVAWRSSKRFLEKHGDLITDAIQSAQAEEDNG